MRQILVCLACILASTVTAHAAPSLAAQYETLAWQEYPDLKLHDQPALVNRMFPDYDATALIESRYAEYELTDRLQAGLITCRSRRTGSLAVIHYGADGYSRLALYNLPLQPGDETTISLLLPQETESGLTRLMFWREPPDASRLDLLARHPNWAGEQVPGVLFQRWFERGSCRVYFLPWVDEFRPVIEQQLYRLQADWPWCAAAPATDGTIRGKDCSVIFDGQTELSFDEYGGYGQWIVDWSSYLELVFSLPSGYIGESAELVVYIGEEHLFQLIAQPTVEITVNGWPLSPMEALEGIGSRMQPHTFEVSHYLSGGINRILISTGTMYGEELLIDGLELWVY